MEFRSITRSLVTSAATASLWIHPQASDIFFILFVGPAGPDPPFCPEGQGSSSLGKPELQGMRSPWLQRTGRVLPGLLALALPFLVWQERMPHAGDVHPIEGIRPGGSPQSGEQGACKAR